MGTLLSYSVSSAIVLALLYLTYKWVLASENYHRLNRAILWSIYIVALCIVPLSGAIDRLMPAQEVTPAYMGIGELVPLGPVSVAPSPAAWLGWLAVIYLAGAATVTAMTLWNLLRLVAIIRRGERIEADGVSVVLTRDSTLAPFSFGRTIVIPENDFRESGAMILRHERSHVELHHWVDLLMTQAVCIFQWFNPAAWLMREEFKTVHEYQADRRVIASGVNAREYQLLLIKKAVGARFPSLANSLNHSKLKKRITMMYNQKTQRRCALRPLALVPALAAALWVTQLPAVASAISTLGDAALPAPDHKVSEIAAPVQTDAGVADLYSESDMALVAATDAETTADTAPANASRTPDSADQVFEMAEKMPEYPGGLAALMQFLADNLRYPKGAEDVSGRVVVQFVVDKDGSVRDPKITKSVDPLFDAEALRVVSMLPKFTPGEIDSKPVAVEYALPISFKAYEPSKASTPTADRSTPTAATTGQTPKTMSVTSTDNKTGKRTTYTTSTSSSISISNSDDGSTITTTRTVTDDGTTTTTVINENGAVDKDGRRIPKVTVINPDGKDVQPEIYVDGKLYTGDISDLHASDIAAMNVDKSGQRIRIDITTRH